MLAGTLYTRASKVLLIWAVAFFVSLVVFNNLTDYDSNYAFASQVLKMETTFPGNRAMWRAIDSPFLDHALYWIIIFVEAAIAVLCWLGGLRLFSSIKDASRFNNAKSVAISGLTLGITLWFTRLITMAGGMVLDVAFGRVEWSGGSFSLGCNPWHRASVSRAT
jgi:predicted small integral membrane protein